MKIRVVRREFTDVSTTGELSTDGTFRCFTLEDPVRPRGVKIPGATAIPTGLYVATVYRSPRLGYLVVLLHDVPDFTASEIHRGNKAGDTRGCILVGQKKLPNVVLESKLAHLELMRRVLSAAVRHEPLTVEVTGERVWPSG